MLQFRSDMCRHAQLTRAASPRHLSDGGRTAPTNPDITMGGLGLSTHTYLQKLICLCGII